MQRLRSDFVDQLNLEDAVLAETAATRNLVPGEPWIDVVHQRSEEIAAWVRSRLLSGLPHSPDVIVSTRKVGNGIRPVPISGVAERVVYRALTEHILREEELADRTPEEYRKFVIGPIEYAYQDTAGFRRLNNARLQYVLESDVTAFYQYVDHEILSQELQMQTGQVETVEYLVELLSEMTGRRFGLPQLLDPSDRLSEMYIRIVERDLVRRGLPVWRFNDDFRIGCVDYQHALECVETLSDAAREIGLVVGDHKTRTTKFSNYVFWNLSIDIDEEGIDFDPLLLDTAVPDYAAADEAQTIEAALSTIARLHVGSDRRIDLKDVTADDVRDIRRAINAFAKYQHQGGLEMFTPLLQFVPALTPNLCRYLIRLAEASVTLTAEAWDRVIKHDMSDWQKLWLTHVARLTSIAGQRPERIRWIREHLSGRTHSALQAEATLALAEAGAVGFQQVDSMLRSAPDVLAPWYVIAAGRLAGQPQGPSNAQLQAVRQSSPLFDCLIRP